MKTTLFRTITVLTLLIGITTTLHAQRVKGNGKLIEKTRQAGDFDALDVSRSEHEIVVFDGFEKARQGSGIM